MHRAIVVAAFAVALSFFLLQRTQLLGAFYEPALLAGVGSFFLIAAHFATGAEKREHPVGMLNEAESR
jgi:hypothetical protein